MIYTYIAKFFTGLSKQVITIGAAIAGLAFLFLGHKYKVKKAGYKGEETGREEEQERIKLETRKQTLDIKEKAVEIKKTIDRGTADVDDLRRRMRESATPSNRDQ